jgi:hypothetical protein
MDKSCIIPNFDKQYIVFYHEPILISKKESTFNLGPNYRIVTVHIPGTGINNILSKIILNQIHSKMQLINNLFYIRCPIAKQKVKENIEKCFIIDWLLEKHKEPISNQQVIEDLTSIGDKHAFEQENITNRTKLIAYMETINLQSIKQYLGFEIITYNPNELAPTLTLDFNKALTIKSGIFNLDEINKSNQNKSLVKFDDKKYINDKSFFKTIKPEIKTGIIVFLSCGSNDVQKTQYPINYSK